MIKSAILNGSFEFLCVKNVLSDICLIAVMESDRMTIFWKFVEIAYLMDKCMAESSAEAKDMNQGSGTTNRVMRQELNLS